MYSVKKNIIYSMLLSLGNIIFPILIFPYASRIIGPEGTGICNFSSSLITFFVIIADFGIPIYGVIEISKVGNNKKELEKLTRELMLISIIFAVISYFLFLILMFLNDKIRNNSEIILINSILILMTSIGAEWFYKGIEEFKYITDRSMLLKLIGGISIFVLLKDKGDINYYVAVPVLISIIQVIINLLYIRKFIKIGFKDKCDLKKHIKPLSVIFVTNMATAVYLNIDTIILGFMTDDRTVGFYTAATKISKMMILIVTSISTALIPRMAYYLGNNNRNEYKILGNKSINVFMMLTLPVTIGLIIFSENIINIFVGEKFNGSILTTQIVAPIIILSAMINFISMQVLYPNKREKDVLISVVFGAVLSFFINIFLIAFMGQIGAAIALIVSQTGVFVFQFIKCKEYFVFDIIDRNKALYVVATVVAFACGIFLKKISGGNILWTTLIIPIIVIIYFSLLITMKEEICTAQSRKIKEMVREKIKK